MIEIKMETRTYRLRGESPLLGSNPATDDLHSRFVAAKAANAERRAAEEAMLPVPEQIQDDDFDSRGLTVFLRDNKGRLCIGNHAIKGFFKGALGTLKEQVGMSAVKTKVDKLLFIAPDFVTICDGHGEPQKEPDYHKERPLRAETAMGPRETLVSSECVDCPWQIEFSVTVVANSGTRASRPLDFEVVETALEYGKLHGLGQWRNGGYGRFSWERIDGGDKA